MRHIIAVKVEDSPGTDSLRSRTGDVCFVAPISEAKRRWDQNLERGCCTQAQYDDAMIPDGSGDMAYPFSKMEKRHFFCFTADLTTLQSEEIFGPLEDEDGDTVSHHKARIFLNDDGSGRRHLTYFSDTDQVRKPYSSDSQARIMSADTITEVRYDKPAQNEEITRKPAPTTRGGR